MANPTDPLPPGLDRACGHAHTFSRCVCRAHNLIEWEPNSRSDMEIAYRLDFIRDNLTKIGAIALAKGLGVQCITEHPQFGHYGIPGQSYFQLIEPLLRKFESGFGRMLRMPWGLELELVPQGKEIQPAISDAEDPEEFGVASITMVRRAEIILGGIHHKFYRDQPLRDTEGYYAVMKDSILALGRLRAQMQAEGRGGKIYVLAHPWYCASELNRYQDAHINLRFNSGQNVELAHLMFENGVVPEFNSSCISRGHDELGITDPRSTHSHSTLIGTYVDLAVADGVVPNVSFGSDAHTSQAIGTIDVRPLLRAGSNQLPLVRNVLEDFLDSSTNRRSV